jgi:alkylhydroperoxidase/carboxymuconolactone decarboxylase family protein YurZ
MSSPRAWREVLQDYDPAAVGQVNAFLGYFNDQSAVSPVTRELIIIAAALAVRSRPSTVAHVKRAIQDGASGSELYAAVGLAATIGGMPTLIDGLAILDELGVKAEAS